MSDGTLHLQLLMQLMTTQVKRTTLLDIAKVLMAPSLPKGGYGSQSASGMVLSSFDHKNKDCFTVPREELRTPALAASGSNVSTSVIEQR